MEGFAKKLMSATAAATATATSGCRPRNWRGMHGRRRTRRLHALLAAIAKGSGGLGALHANERTVEFRPVHRRGTFHGRGSDPGNTYRAFIALRRGAGKFLPNGRRSRRT